MPFSLKNILKCQIDNIKQVLNDGKPFYFSWLKTLRFDCGQNECWSEYRKTSNDILVHSVPLQRLQDESVVDVSHILRSYSLYFDVIIKGIGQRVLFIKVLLLRFAYFINFLEDLTDKFGYLGTKVAVSGWFEFVHAVYAKVVCLDCYLNSPKQILLALGPNEFEYGVVYDGNAFGDVLGTV